MTHAPPSPRTKPPEVRREELMDAAEALFVEKGVAAASIDGIVAAAGVSKGGFYHHFASKDAILIALQDRFVADFCADIQSAQARLAGEDWPRRLEALVRTSAGSFFARQAVHDVVFHDFKPPERREMNQNAVVDLLADFLRAGMAAGAWSLSDPRLTAVMLFHALHGACDEAVLEPHRVSREAAVDYLLLFFRRVLALA